MGGLWGKMWGIEVGGKVGRMMKMTERAGSAVMLDGEISKYFEILQEIAQGCTIRRHPLHSKFIRRGRLE